MTVEMRVVIGGMKKLKIFLVKKIDTRQENNTSSKFYFIPQRVNPVLFVSHTKIRKNFSRKTSFKFFLVSWFIAFFFYSFFFSVPYPLQVLKKKKRFALWRKYSRWGSRLGETDWNKCCICTRWGPSQVFLLDSSWLSLVCARKTDSTRVPKMKIKPSMRQEENGEKVFSMMIYVTASLYREIHYFQSFFFFYSY